MNRLFLVLAFPALSFGALSPADSEFFEKNIRPIVVSECVECHGVEKQKGGLRLDYRDGWKKGGDSGAAIVPGEPAKSLFIKAIRHDDAAMKMPEKRPKLSADVIANFEKWIASGAPDPRDEPPKEMPAVAWESLVAERAKWWSFQPVRDPQIPANSGWSEHAVDRFLLSKMAPAGLQPAADAGPVVLVRRISFLLTGLPPSPEEVKAFIEAPAASRVSAVVERLLASPRFGEHWGRHWLDLVRYAETHGSEGDPEIPEAWRYRDYVVRAMNADLPWDVLIREHVAGDGVAPRPGPGGTNDALLGLAHWRLVEHGFQPIDTRDEQVKTVDSQIDVLTKAFQGITVSCARCHDHKFDAVSQRDYTALAGILESSRPTMLTLDFPEKLELHRDTLAAAQAKVKAALVEAWLAEAEKIPAHISNAAANDLEIARIEKELDSATTKRNGIRAAVYGRFLKSRGLDKPGEIPPQPFERWSFDSKTVLREKPATNGGISAIHGFIEGDATIRDGKLVLGGAGFVRTMPLGKRLPQKTLEAWVKLAAFEQGGGGVVSHESEDGVVFDSIVFAEHAPRKWTAGSDNFRRGKNLDEPNENAATERFVHMAITYAADGTIAMFRDGIPYGQPWKPVNPPGDLLENSRVMFGLRHSPSGGNRLLRGEIDEARIYDRALTPAEVLASFRAGMEFEKLGEAEMSGFWTDAEKAMGRQLGVTQDGLTKRLAELRGDPANKSGRTPWGIALADAAKDVRSPLRVQEDISFRLKAGLHTEFHSGAGVSDVKRGEFTIEPAGGRVVATLLPEGVAAGVLTRKFGGGAATARFKITTDSISIRASGANAWGRLIVDGYPLGSNPIFPRAHINNAEPRWLKLDTKYRKGSMAYVEFATAEDLTRREKEGEPSWFCVEAIVPHDGANPHDAAEKIPAPVRAAAAIGAAVREAILAWRDGKLTAPQHALLDFLIRRDLLPNHAASLASVTEFRRLEAAAPVPQRAPGVFDADCYDAAFLPRGDHLKPGKPVPRGYLALLSRVDDDRPKNTSGRLQLSAAITAPWNPLTSRVMANRIWLHTFGRGLVATPDNFGKMGELPSHPELLDHLATRFTAEGWSLKKMLRYLISTRTFQLASEPSAAALERDPGNMLMSHARVRRLTAESIRDTLLAVSGKLDVTSFGPSDRTGNRRSIYQQIRRNSLNPFLATFDAPKPFSTLGRRDATNVPGQSLTMLNDAFVISCAEDWAKKQPDIATMFVTAFGRAATAPELEAARGYAGESLRDLAHALMNAKEFIYLR